MRRVRVLVAVVLALFMMTSVPAGAAPPAPRDSVTFRGTSALAVWMSEEDEVPVGVPRVVYVAGFSDTTTVRTHSAGSKPQSAVQESLVAMAMMLPAAEPGGDPIPAEIWCMAPPASFTIDRALTTAALRYSCEALVLTGDDEPTGETLPLAVTATWTGVGSLTQEKSVTKGSDETGWWLDRSRSTVRQAVADVTITGPDGVLFAGRIGGNDKDQSEMSDTAQGHLYHANR